MEIDRTTVPGAGVLHHLCSRSGARFALLVKADQARHLLAYRDGYDEPVVDIALELDEADQVAQLLQSRSVHERLADVHNRLAELERRLDHLTGK
ncbi:hypothetical protein [Nocardia donostiensis]|uniref:Potassium/proton antiporter subunit KhtT-like N-terminal domain-containing protein n=1 Tax=Nocardia donostiensis TaxID=1538463 RepID=A0A1W0BKB4_9NOCA|nr:hypothetical protein [Nocardia donostiensis]ONM48970.1 hypothetical protein B0T46_10455 [Nocardia donostiensis]OQS15588.1 hypothetical protein B0T36_09585 [Nocardia donostiensis]OQS22964.1 hypothetical protein B0T44_04010 [Nocardia donostiensis]